MARTKILTGLIAVLLLAGCSSGKRAIVVGSKNFTEQLILGEIIAQHLEQRLGEKVDRKLNLGGTLLAHQALTSGQIDLYPEYTGTALTAVLKQPPDKDPQAVLDKVRSEYQRRWGVEWLDPLGFNNTFAMVIRGEDARKNGVATLSDAGRYRPGWKLGTGYEFSERPDGLAGLLKTYPLVLIGKPKTMDLGLLYSAIQQKQVDLVAGNSTDGMLSVMDLKVLADDQRYFPPYFAAIAVRAESMQKNAVLRGFLQELSGKLTDDAMRKLNYQVDGEHRPLREVAATFLNRMRQLSPPVASEQPMSPASNSNTTPGSPKNQ